MTQQSAFHFKTITPDLIHDALIEVGLYPDSGIIELNSYENRVYQFLDEQHKRYVVKFYRPTRWNRTQIQEEHDFMLSLYEAGLSVIAPLFFAGQTVLEYRGFLYAVFPSVGGRQYETDNLLQLEEVGRLIGRIHQIGYQHHFSTRPTIGIDEYLITPRNILANTPLLPGKLKQNFLFVLDELIVEVKKRWSQPHSYLRLQGDCHPGNILWRDGPFIVDFDDARNGPAVQDLWMLLNGERREQRIQLEILLEAYTEYTHFDNEQLALIEPLRAMRMIHYLSWIVRRWEEPAFPRAFPWMIEYDFWRKQQLLFSEQINALNEQPLQPGLIY
ncbi:MULTISPECIES: serine/threonine protein kinase [unclassified Arsenophonus]|uniref:serine/threonine protein kinase n=1 Tax=unclassified Arsenophonus TaxID=2627083 RepID=UPI00285F6A27|nr:serine/threonine protein kinase [Arsenophonus sp.]MDR5610349.1 serine/threonine protein kinase [Arsenophonus sp.]MDR5614148.1 serine/threonine protein kinase [Arsenophonus sp.]